MGGPHPVEAVPVGDVEVAGLFRGVAVGGRHLLADGGEGVVLVRVHARRGVRRRVAVGPEHQLRVRVEVDVGLDLLHAADHPTVDEVAQRLRLGCGERRRPPVGLRRGGAGRAAAAAPVVGPVAVQVGADVGRTAVGLPVLAPGPVRPGGDVVLAAVRVDRRHDPDLPAVDDVGDPGVGAVAVGEQVEQVDRHLDGQVLTGVLLGVEQDLGLVLVGADVVGDLHRHQVAALVRRTDADLAGDRRMVGDDLVHDGGQFRVVVVVGVGGREGHRADLAGAALGVGRRGQRFQPEAELADLGGLTRGRRDVQDAVFGVVDGGSGAGHRVAVGEGPGAEHPVAGGGRLGGPVRCGSGGDRTGGDGDDAQPGDDGEHQDAAERDGRAEGHQLPPRWAGDPAR